MLDTKKIIEVNDIKYPFVFDLNVMAEIQETYGSLDTWVKTIEPESGEPSLKELINVMRMAVNEGIDIENDEKGETRQFLSNKKVGRILTEIGMGNASKIMMDLAVDSISDGKSKNE